MAALLPTRGDVSGGLTLSGSILDLVQLGTYAANDKFTLFAYEGAAITSGFKDLSNAAIADDSIFTDAGGTWKLNYNDTSAGLNGGLGTNDVTTTAIPEPRATAVLGGLGVLCLLLRRRTA